MIASIIQPALLVAEGFNPFASAAGATFWTWVIFLSSLFFMWKFVFGPITQALESRDGQVEDAITAAEAARKEAEAQTAATKQELDTARAEAKLMVQNAVSRAERQAEEALANAKLEADRQLKAAQAEIDAAKRKALLEIRNEVVELAINSAGKILQQDLNDEEHQRMVTEFMSSAQSGSN